MIAYQWIATMWPQKTTLIFMKNNLMSESWVESMKKNIAYYVKEIDELRQQVNQLADENEKLKKEYGISTDRQIAAFIAQIGVESDPFCSYPLINFSDRGVLSHERYGL